MGNAALFTVIILIFSSTVLLLVSCLSCLVLLFSCFSLFAFLELIGGKIIGYYLLAVWLYLFVFFFVVFLGSIIHTLQFLQVT